MRNNGRLLDAATLTTVAVAPGVAVSAMVAVAAAVCAPLVARVFPVPAIVLALIIGVVLHPLATWDLLSPGITFSVKVILRWAVALLGLRIALGDIVSLGLWTAAMVVSVMIATIIAGLVVARWLGQRDSYGALAGVGTAVCGASATLATSTVLPEYKGKEADVVFVVVAVNTLSTIAMVVYPLFTVSLGFDEQATGILFGATIHDVAQVAGAAYSVSESVGNTAVVVKLFRVFLLLPAVLVVGYYFSHRVSAARIPIPVFAIFFLLLCLANTVISTLHGLAPLYAPIKTSLVSISNWGLLIAIGALGLGTSITAIGRIGWRHVVTVMTTTVVILVLTLISLRLF